MKTLIFFFLNSSFVTCSVSGNGLNLLIKIKVKFSEWLFKTECVDSRTTENNLYMIKILYVITHFFFYLLKPSFPNLNFHQRFSGTCKIITSDFDLFQILFLCSICFSWILKITFFLYGNYDNQLICIYTWWHDWNWKQFWIFTMPLFSWQYKMTLFSSLNLFNLFM